MTPRTLPKSALIVAVVSFLALATLATLFSPTSTSPVVAFQAAQVNDVRLLGIANQDAADARVVERVDAYLVLEEAALSAAEADEAAVIAIDAFLDAQTPPAPAVPSGSVWDRLAECESNQRWSYNGGSGFDGGLQFHPKTWTAYKLQGYPDFAWQATRDEQIAAAKKVLAVQGWGAWPACSRKLGLR